MAISFFRLAKTLGIWYVASWWPVHAHATLFLGGATDPFSAGSPLLAALVLLSLLAVRQMERHACHYLAPATLSGGQSRVNESEGEKSIPYIRHDCRLSWSTFLLLDAT